MACLYLAMRAGIVQLGARFSATCTLRHSSAVSLRRACLTASAAPQVMARTDGLLPHPRQGLPDVPKMDITFVLVKGDFQKSYR